MEQSITNVCRSKDRLLFLKQEQEKYAEGSKDWTYIQENINRIVAQNYLEYVNR
jgi:hypothetical protein